MIRRIDTIQLSKLLKKGVILIDVRETDEINKGSIPGGINWPLSSFGDRKKDLPKKAPILFYCSSGLRSVVAAELAKEWTEQDIYSLDGGFREYEEIEQGA